MKKESQDKYNQVIALLQEIHDIVAMTLSMTDDPVITNLTPIQLIKETIGSMELLDKMSSEQLQELDKSIIKELYDKDNNDVLVHIDESVTKKILQ